jgi:hypothetical protein
MKNCFPIWFHLLGKKKGRLLKVKGRHHHQCLLYITRGPEENLSTHHHPFTMHDRTNQTRRCFTRLVTKLSLPSSRCCKLYSASCWSHVRVVRNHGLAPPKPAHTLMTKHDWARKCIEKRCWWRQKVPIMACSRQGNDASLIKSIGEDVANPSTRNTDLITSYNWFIFLSQFCFLPPQVFKGINTSDDTIRSFIF